MIDQFGVRLELENGMLQIIGEKEMRKLSFYKLKSINVLRHGTISTSVLEKAAMHQVPVLIYDLRGRVTVWCWSHKYGNIANLRKQQVIFCDAKEGMQWIKKVLTNKLELQVSNLKWLKDRVSGAKEVIELQMQKMNEYKERIDQADQYDSLRGIEGSYARLYWGAVAIGIERVIKIEGRERRAPKDRFNKCLNYLYGILYGLVESSLLMAGLDPYLGIMHVIRHNEPTLAYDHIEPFRPWADKLLMEMFLKNEISEGWINQETGFIEKEGRKQLIENFFSLLNERSLLNGKKIKRMDHIHHASNLLVQTIKEIQ